MNAFSRSLRLNIGVIADSVAFSAFLKSLKEEKRASRGKSEIISQIVVNIVMR